MPSQQRDGCGKRKRPQTNSADGGGSQVIHNRNTTGPFDSKSRSKVRKTSTDAQEESFRDPTNLQAKIQKREAFVEDVQVGDEVNEAWHKLSTLTSKSAFAWMDEKELTLATDDYGRDLNNVQALHRKHEGTERNLAALESKIDKLGSETNRLCQLYPEKSSDIATKMDEVKSCWEALKLGAEQRNRGFDRSYNRHRFMADYRELIKCIQALIQSSELANDVSGAEATTVLSIGLMVPPANVLVRYNWPKTVLLPGICPGISKTTAEGGSVIYIEVANAFTKELGTIVHFGQWDGMAIDAMRTAHTMVKNWISTEYPLNKKLFKTALAMNIVGTVHMHAGPSAGLPMTLAIASWATNRRVRNRRVFTGKVSLVGGWITAVGGIAQKTTAAQECGFSRLIGSHQNAVDFQQIPANQRTNIEYRSVQFFADVVNDHLNSHPLEE